MGMFSWLSRSGKSAGRSQRVIVKQVRKLLNEAIQTGERLRAIAILTDDGSDDAIYGLLMRYTFRTPVQIIDEDEKERVYQSLAALGERAVPTILRFVHDEARGERVREIAGQRFSAAMPAVYWPVRALAEIAGEEVAEDLLLGEIDSITEGYDRDVAQKIELVSNLREFHSDRAIEKLLALLEDETEEIRVMAIDGLTTSERPEATEHLVKLLLKEGETLRIRTMILEYLVENEASVKQWKKEMTGALPEAFWLDDTGIIRRRR